jgi:hypothetical protein
MPDTLDELFSALDALQELTEKFCVSYPDGTWNSAGQQACTNALFVLAHHGRFKIETVDPKHSRVQGIFLGEGSHHGRLSR